MTNTVVSREELSRQQIENSLHLVHAAPGRIRLRATDTSIKPILKTFLKQLWQQDGVGEVYLNQQTGSLTIAFDENKLPLPQMLSMLQQLGVSQQPTSSEEKKADPFAAWKSVDFWKEQGLDFIPLVAGLAVTGGLGLSGLAAIPVYMITSSAARQAIDLTRGEGQKSQVASRKSQVGSQNLESLEPSDYKLLHSIPGRVRFHVPRLAQERAYALRLQRLLKADTQVKHFRINRDAASVAIAYEPRDIPVSHWLDLLQMAEEEGAANKSDMKAPAEPAMMANQPLLEENQPIAPEQAITAPPPEEENQDNLPLESITIVQQTSLETIELTSFWTEMKPPALSLSLAFLANLPLQTAPD